jgi:hypothetical protein
MENLGIFYGHLGTFKPTWCILPPFGIFCGNLACFSHFGLLEEEQSGNRVLHLNLESRKINTIFRRLP